MVDFCWCSFRVWHCNEHRDALVSALEQTVSATGIWLRTEKGMREAEGLEVTDGLLRGESPPQPLFLEENGVQFGVDVQRGQKTGCFLDQRKIAWRLSLQQAARVLTPSASPVDLASQPWSRRCSVGVGIDSSELALNWLPPMLNSMASRIAANGSVRKFATLT